MRTLLYCLGLLFATPAFANSIEDGLCHARPKSVEKMEKVERLCRAFVRSLGQLPGETVKEVQAMLSPESLKVMGMMTATWAGSQGIPVVGQTVDAVLLTVGVILAAAQAAIVKEALWNYFNCATEATTEEGLDRAATHLARAVATVGVSVVLFILTKKVSNKLGGKPGPSEPPPGPPPDWLPEPVPVPAGGPFSSPARVASGVIPGTAVAPSLAVATGRLGGGRPPPEGLKPKRLDLQAFMGWIEKAKRRPTPDRSDAYKYQIDHAGPEEMLVSGGGQEVWADGVRLEKARLVEVKHVGDSSNSPFIPGSKCRDAIRAMIQQNLSDEFMRYTAVIKDPSTPAMALEVIVNDARAVPFFEALLKQFGIPGEVLVRP